MAGNVTGTIGADNVNLNNAATESTLAALLKIAQIDSKNLLDIAKKTFPDIELKNFEEEILAGTDAQRQETEATVQNTRAIEQEQQRHTRNISIVSQLNESMTKLMDGTAQVSDIFGAFKMLPGLLGVFASGLERVALIQQQNFAAYQKLTDAGISFAGSLTDLRLAAANSYMTLDSFATLMKNNSAALSKFGGSTNEGAIAFAKFSKNLLSSDVGTQLLSLGYTAEEANQSMINYLAATGISNAKDLETNSKLRTGAAEYLTELDRLAQVTGKSRQEQENTMKKLQLDAEVQMTAARMAPEERARFMQNVKYMTDQYGDAGKDMALAQAQHRAVVTEEGKTLSALAPGMQDAMERMAKAQVGSKEYLDAQNDMALAAQQGLNQIPLAAFSTSDSLKKLSQAQLTVAEQEKAGLTTKEALNARDQKVAQEQKARADSQASDMAAANKGMAALGAALWTAFSPLISPLTSLLGYFGKFASWLADLMNKGGMLTTVFAGLATVAATLLLYESRKAIAAATGGAISGVAGVLSGGGKKGGGGPLDALGGVGGGIGPALVGLSEGLMAFTNPMLLLGATILSGSLAILITGIGAGIAATMYLIGLSLPTFSEGLRTLSEVDASNLGNVALGIGELGLGLMTFGPFALFGIPAGIALNSLADGVSKLANVDAAKLDQVADALQRVKDATPSATEIVRIGIAAMVSKAVGPSESAASPAATSSQSSTGEAGINAAGDMKRLNTMTEEMLKVMKENVEYTKRTLSAIKGLSGSGYKF